ncbi:amino acid adenylation domain-containing protein [Oxalobacteraceae bacterium]|nr:amino acid adenylation domain-containing protein [Oxalobacteraceae bacterium]
MQFNPLQLAQRIAALPAAKRKLLLQRLGEQGVDVAALPIVAANRGGPLPLSYAQRGMWLTWRMAPHSAAYNMEGTLVLRGAVDAAAMASAVDALAARHEVLRTVFRAAADGADSQDAEQLVRDAASGVLELLDLSGVAVEQREDWAAEQVATHTGAPFDLEAGPVWRVLLVKLDEQTHWLSIVVHHIVADGWSASVLMRELGTLYAAHASGVPAALPVLPIQFADYAIWQRDWAEAGELDRQLAYWRGQLGEDHTPLALPLDRPRPRERSDAAAQHRFVLRGRAAAGIAQLAEKHGCTRFMVMLALLKLALAHLSGASHVAVGSPVANRQRAETQGLVGYLLNVLVLRTRVDLQASFDNLLEQVRATVLDAQSHADCPFDLLVSQLVGRREVGLHPLFQVKCTEQQPVAGVAGFGGLDVGVHHGAAKLAHFDLSLDFAAQGGEIVCGLSYACDIFDEATVAGIAELLDMLALRVSADARAPLATLLPQRASAHSTGEVRALSDADDVLACWDRAVAATPDAAAVRYEDDELSFAQLDQLSDALALRLQQHGVGPEVRVGVHAPRSIELVLGLLATFKAGGVYVPLDPALPAERLRYQAQDSKVALLLCSAEPAWDSGVPQLALTLAPLAASDFKPSAISADQAAYVIYTSGSTGQPKGVVISRGSLANYVQGVLARLELDALPAGEGSMAMVSTVAADLGHTVLFGALCAGRLLHLISAERAFDPDRFAEYMARHQVDVLKIVPSHLRALLSAAVPANVLPRQRLIVGGEATRWALLEKLQLLRPGMQVLNHYGPTETTVGILTQPAQSAAYSAFTLPVGRPLSNSAAWVLDDRLEPVAAGVTGELYLGGPGVARGYQARAGQSAERFVASPFGDGQRLYRSGDRVRMLADGALEFLGRVDDQVKVRGYRVELREVVQALLAQAGVAAAEVIARDSDDGRTQLHGYVVAQAGALLDGAALALQLGVSLPDYMVPSAVMVLDAMPLNANGKLDRKALPLPVQDLSGDFEAPQGEVEQALAEVWADVMGLERVGRHDNFFELGGDSILSLQIVARSRKRGYKVAPKHLMERQTIAAIAVLAQPLAAAAGSAKVQGGANSNAAASSAKVIAPREGSAFPLLPVQQWFFEQNFDTPTHWNQSMLLSCTEAPHPSRLEAVIGHLVAQHEALRTRFVHQTDGWRQQVGSAGAVFASVDLSGESDPAAAITRVADAAQRSLTLELPFRATWMTLGEGQGGRLLLVAHHLVVDGVSWRVILDDMQTLYAQGGRGETLALPTPASSVLDWVESLRQHAVGESLAAQLPYWHALTAQAEPSLPVDYPLGSNTLADAQTLSLQLDAGSTAQLLGPVHKAYRTQVNDLLLAALARTLCEWAQRDSVLVELEGHGREDLFEAVDLSRSVGWFTALYPQRLSGADAAPGARLQAVKEQLRQLPGRGLGYGVLRYVARDPGLANAPGKPQVTFNYLGQTDQTLAPEALWQLAPESAGQSRAASSIRRSWFDVGAIVRAGQLQLSWTFSRALHSEAVVGMLLERLRHHLNLLIAHCTSAAAGVTPSDFPLAALTQPQLDALALPAAQLEDLYPLAPMQAGILFHSVLTPTSKAYVNQLCVDIDGLDGTRFGQAWQAAVARHAILRTGFVQHDRGALQWVSRTAVLPVLELDWRERADQERALAELAAQDHARGFDLSAPPLMRLTLIRTGANRHHVIWTRHHLLLDGWSSSRLLTEVLGRYAGKADAGVPARYRDYIGWLDQLLAGPARAYWSELLAGLETPTMLSAALPQTGREDAYQFHFDALDRTATAQLAEFARAERVTVNTVVQGAWALLLQGYTGQNNVCFGATTAGRPAELAGVEQMLGLFINTLPVLAAPRPQQAVGDFLRQLQAQNLASREHEYVPLYEIQRWAGASGQGLFDSLLVFENYPIDRALRQDSMDGLSAGAMNSYEEVSYALTLTLDLGSTLNIEYAFQGAAMEGAQVRIIALRLRMLLMAMAGRRLARVDQALEYGTVDAALGLGWGEAWPDLAMNASRELDGQDDPVGVRGEAPQGETEQALAALWMEVLELDSVGRHESFFDLGGHSLLALRLARLVQLRLPQLGLTLADLMQRPTVAAAAANRLNVDPRPTVTAY